MTKTQRIAADVQEAYWNAMTEGKRSMARMIAEDVASKANVAERTARRIVQDAVYYYETERGYAGIKKDEIAAGIVGGRCVREWNKLTADAQIEIIELEITYYTAQIKIAKDKGLSMQSVVLTEACIESLQCELKALQVTA